MSRPQSRRWAGQTVAPLLPILALVLIFGTGCGEIDLDLLRDPDRLVAGIRARLEGEADERGAASKGAATTPARTTAATAPTGKSDPTRTSGAGPRAPDMVSIGGEDSNRIYYQFIDDRGRVHFVERLSEVPADWRDRVGFVEMDRPPPLTPREARRSWSLSADETARLLAAHPSAARRTGPGGRSDASILLYSATWCGYCTQARRHLDREGIDYEIRDVDVQAVARELRDKTGRGGVPVLDYDGQILRGYSADQYQRAIASIRG